MALIDKLRTDEEVEAENNALLALLATKPVAQSANWSKEDEQIACYQEVLALRADPAALFVDAERIIDRYTRTVGYKFICRAIKGQPIEQCR